MGQQTLQNQSTIQPTSLQITFYHFDEAPYPDYHGIIHFGMGRILNDS